MDIKEPTRAWFAIFNMTAIGLTFSLTLVSHFFLGINDLDEASSPYETSFLVLLILIPIAVVLSIVMSQWKRSVPWAVFGVLASLSPLLFILVGFVVSFISYTFLQGV